MDKTFQRPAKPQLATTHNANKFTFVAAWSAGDFNADGQVDGSDFGIWNSNKFTVSDGIARAQEAHSHGVVAFRAVDQGYVDKREDIVTVEWRYRHIDHVFAYLEGG